jgi:hypothetical protein
MRHFIGLEPASAPAVPTPPGALEEHAGRYRATLATLEVAVEGDILVATDVSPERQFAERSLRPLPVEPARLVFVSPDRAAITSGPHAGGHVEFLRDHHGAIAWLRWDGRLARRE